MTFLGKLFVMTNVAVSLMLAFAALGLYYTGVDWGYDVTKPGQQGGVIKQKQDEIADVQKMQLPTEGAWKASRPVLWQAEEERRDARAYFVSELEHNRSKASPGDKPARAVEVNNFRAVRQKGKPNRPEMKDAKVRGDVTDLYSRTYYEAEYEKNHKANLILLDEVSKEFQKDAELTKQIYDKGTNTGLQPDLVSERVKREGLEAERRLVKPLYVNTAVESELSLKRLTAMQERIRQLRAYCEKRKMDVELTKP